MKTLKYLNKRIFVCLSLALIFLIVASFVASSGEAQREKININITQYPETAYRDDEVIFTGYIIQPPELPYTGKYCFEIVDPEGNMIKGYPIKFDIENKEKSSIKSSWEIPDDPIEAPIGSYEGTITFPCPDPRISATAHFKLVETLLVIQKFNDTNHNRKIDDGEELQGWEFEVTDSKGKATSHFTNNKGEIRIKIDAGQEGDYKITEIIKEPKKWKLIKKDTNAPVIDKGEEWIVIRVEKEKKSKVQFLNNFSLPPTKLIIWKFDDSNQNNELDNDDEVLPGWNFNITDPAGKIRTHITNDAGEIRIVVPEEYAGKEYTIEETLQPKWELVLPIEQPVHVKVPMGETKTVQFLNYKPNTTILIQKFNDTNRNREIDNLDESLRNWEYDVTNPAGETRLYKTDGYGEILIDILDGKEGDYKIAEIIKEPDKWKLIKIDTDKTAPILDQDKQWIKIRVEKGKQSEVRFLNYKPNTTILIQKFNDTNQNGKVDSEDERLRGWEFKVTDPGGKTTTHFTNDTGEKRIKIPIGYEGKVYTIGEILKHNWTAITSTKQTKKVVEGKTTLFEFLNKPQTNLSIIKFYDHNQKRVQDPGDQGLAWNFSIMFPDGSVKRIRTDENGRYRLRNIPVGEYEITEEPRGCRWTSSTDMTQKVEVKGGQETIAQFRNYIAECCILPGCVWKNRDKNIEVCKSVDPCSVALGKEEEEVTIYLGLCVDPKHIINGTKVENISVIDTLHSQFTIVNGSFSEEPNARRRNPDDTTTITWDIPSLCCEEWNVSFKVTVAFALPIDVTDTSERITSKVIYEDPIETGRRELSIPEGTLKCIPQPPIWCYVLGVLLVISISIEITLELKRRKKEKPKEKE